MWGQPPRLSTDANGNTVLRGPGNGAFDRFPLPLNPNGLDWLTDTINGFDIYDEGLVLRPTIWFDPSSSNAAQRGTFNSPYTSMSDVAKRCKGDMSGQRLGIKRGSTLSVGQTGFELLNLYASASDPFRIIPYGDAEALPIISGLVTVPAARWASHSGSVYKVDLDDLVTDGVLTSSTYMDVYQSEIRLAAQTSLANVTAAGQSFFDNSTKILYAWLYDSEVPTTQCQLGAPNIGLSIKYSDVATSGGIIVAGVHVKGTRGNGISFGASDVATISAASTLCIYGCESEHNGAYGSGLGNDGFSIYGPSATVCASGVEVKGNYVNDCLNNAVELAYVDGYTVEHNNAVDHCGNGIIELWASCRNGKVRYNQCTGRIDPVQIGAVTPRGIWLTDYEVASSADADLTGAANANNVFAFNLVRNTSIGASIQSGTGTEMHHNAFLGNLTGVDFGRYSASSDAGTRTMSMDYSNNVLQNDASLGTVSGGGFFYSGVEQANQSSKNVVCTITGDNNVYLRKGDANKGSARLTVAGTSTFYLGQAQQASYRTQVSGFDSLAYLGDANAMDYFDSDGKPTASNTACVGTGATGITNIGTMDIVGRPYDSAVAGNVGAYQA